MRDQLLIVIIVILLIVIVVENIFLLSTYITSPLVQNPEQLSKIPKMLQVIQYVCNYVMC